MTESVFIQNDRSIEERQDTLKTNIENKSFFDKAMDYTGINYVSNLFKNDKKEDLKEKNIEEKPYTSLYDILERNYLNEQKEEININDIKESGKKVIDKNNEDLKLSNEDLEQRKIEVSPETNVPNSLKIDIIKNNGNIDPRIEKVYDSLNKNGDVVKSKPELVNVILEDASRKIANEMNDNNKKIENNQKLLEDQKAWLVKNVTTSNISSIVNKFVNQPEKEQKVIDKMFDPQTFELIKSMNELNDSKKLLEQIVENEKKSRGTFEVFETDKEKQSKETIEYLNKEFENLSDKFNARVLPQIKELGHDIVGIEQQKIKDDEIKYKEEQEKIRITTEQRIKESTSGSDFNR